LLLPRKPNTQQADFDSHLVRRINVSSGVVTTLAGTATKAGNTSASCQAAFLPLLNQARQALLGTLTVPAAKFNQPVGIAMDSGGTFALVFRI